MEVLSLMLKQAQAEGKIFGIKTSRLLKLIILLFVDDVLIMTKARISDWKEIESIVFILQSIESSHKFP